MVLEMDEEDLIRRNALAARAEGVRWNLWLCAQSTSVFLEAALSH